jgi:hypothetical protein
MDQLARSLFDDESPEVHAERLFIPNGRQALPRLP